MPDTERARPGSGMGQGPALQRFSLEIEDMRFGLSSTIALLGVGISGALHAQDVQDGKEDVAVEEAGAPPATEVAQADGEGEIETILIVGKREDRVSKGATGLNISVAETPQSISTVDRRQMENFAAYNLNDALRLATGINVEEWETNRTNYIARGFEIKSTQIDGVGMPNGWGIVTGAMDSFGYEKLEVIRGANGLLTGVGNSAGTINYVRKRPTNQAQGSLGVSFGSWDFKRIEADYSTPLTADGSWAGRVVVAAEDKDSWLRGKSDDRTFFYGVIDGQIGDNSTLTFGYSHQQANTDGNLWGALVLSNSDGTQAEFPRSASTSLDWTFWDTTTQTAFAEYTYALSPDWNLKASYNFCHVKDDAYLFYVYTLTGLDPDTATGLYGNPGSYPSKNHAHLLDLNLDGNFELFGRTHELIVGINQSTSKENMRWRPVPDTDPNWGALPAFPYPGDIFPEPQWGETIFYSLSKQRLTRAYAASRLALTSQLKAVLGFNWSEFQRDGDGVFSGPYDQTESKLAPYAGLTYQIIDNLLGYASYSDIYQPQDEYDINQKYLDPSKGVNYEVGVKADWMGKRLLTTLAWFTAKQEKLATFAGLNSAGQYYYQGIDVESKGYELEVTGKPHDYVDLVLGFTALQLHGDTGNNVYEWVPRRTVNLQLSSQVPGATDLTLGVGGRWQSDIAKLDENTNVMIRQDHYVLLNAFARYDINKALTVRLNLNNLTDEKYITSLYQVGYYAAPRNFVARLDWKF